MAATGVTGHMPDNAAIMRQAEEVLRRVWGYDVFRGRQAEVAGEYLAKGKTVYIEGRLQTRKWQDKDGQDRYTTEITVNEMTMLGGRGDAGGGQSSGEPQQRQQQQRPQGNGGGQQQRQSAPQSRGFDDFEDDIPFD